MPTTLKLEFLPFTAPSKGVLFVFCDDGLKFGLGRARRPRTGRRPHQAGSGVPSDSRASMDRPWKSWPRPVSMCRGWWCSGSAS